LQIRIPVWVGSENWKDLSVLGDNSIKTTKRLRRRKEAGGRKKIEEGLEKEGTRTI